MFLVKFIKNITKIQWFGLFFGLIISLLVWLKMVYILSPNKDHEGNIKITKTELIALTIGIIIALLKWLRLVAVVS